MLCSRIGQISLMNRPTVLANKSFYQTLVKDERVSIQSSSLDDCVPDLNSESFVPPHYSVFSTLACGDDFEPIPVDIPRTPFEQAALDSMLKQSVEFLFAGTSCSTQRKLFPNPEISCSLQDKEPNTIPNATASSHLKDFCKKRTWEPSSPTSSWTDESHDDDLDLVSPSPKRVRRVRSLFRFREYQSLQWDERYEDLLIFRKANGHCSVPYSYPENPSLARWVKRQRYQCKLLQEGRPSTMTEQRLQALERIGFVWDAHSAAWEERLTELRKYLEANGDCNVPTNYELPKLAAWVKCQRRQYKLYMEGLPSTLTEDPIATLNEMGFQWEVRVFKTTRKIEKVRRIVTPQAIEDSLHSS